MKASRLHRPRTDPVLRRLLLEGRRYDPFYGPRLLSDHLPMALTSLRRLGASDDQLECFRERYSARLEPPRFGDVVVEEDPWTGSRGAIARYPGLCRWFTRELQRRGRDAVLHTWIPRLVPAAGVDAFHALIRTALGVESGVDEELACGLAYWVGSWQPMPVDEGPRETGSAAEMFSRLRTDPEFAQIAACTGMFGERLATLSALPGFRRLVRWRGPGVGLADLARESARIYLSCGHFFALHMVTGTHAVRLLSPWAGTPAQVADILWMSLAATYLIIGRPEYGAADVAGETLPARSDVLDAALRHDDEHIAKLACSALSEYETLGLAEHRAILGRIVRGEAELSF